MERVKVYIVSYETVVLRAGFFFNIFAKTQVPKKLKICPSGKNSSQFLSKNSNWGQLFSILEKNLKQVHNFNILPKNYTSSKYVLNS